MGIRLNLNQDDYKAVNIPLIDGVKIENPLIQAKNEVIIEEINDVIKPTMIQKKSNVIVKTIENKVVDSELLKSESVEEITRDNYYGYSQEELTKDDELLNAIIPEYNRFTEKNPMLGISWIDKLKTWKIENKDLNIHTKSKLLDKACKLIIQNFDGYNESANIGKIGAKLNNPLPIHKIYYKNKNILLFDNIVKPLFDIRQVISLLELGESQHYEKFNVYKDKITHYGFSKNKYDGSQLVTKNVIFIDISHFISIFYIFLIHSFCYKYIHDL